MTEADGIENWLILTVSKTRNSRYISSCILHFLLTKRPLSKEDSIKHRSMGLTICYSGRFKNGRFLSAMINELKDIAEIYAWDYHQFEDEFPEDSLGSP